MLGYANIRRGEKMLTSSQEEYLKTIYILKNTENQIRVTDISKKMGCSKPSVNRALNCLKDESLITYEAYGEIKLTQKGIEEAKAIVKRYDILKLFLTEILEVDEDVAEQEATAMKHSVSENTIAKMEQYVNKILDLGDLNCCYDLNSSKCKECVKITAKARIKDKKEVNG
jgi:Mn-dependent DtxR family transcriptional regulator